MTNLSSSRLLFSIVIFGLAAGISPASACSWFSPCKPKIVQRVKPKVTLPIAVKQIQKHELWLKAQDAKFSAYAAEIIALQERIERLEQERR